MAIDLSSIFAANAEELARERAAMSDATQPLRLVFSNKRNSHELEDYARWRSDIIFEPRSISDPMEVGSDPDWPATAPVSSKQFRGVGRAAPFQVVPSQFLKRARFVRPDAPEGNASAFANWVYSIYGKGDGGDEALKRGFEAEREVFEVRGARHGARSLMTACDAEFLAQRRPDWELVHCGLHLEQEGEVPFFLIDGLPVRNRPLRVSPDLIYRNRNTGEVVIVEVKLSRQSLPPNLWPNVWAQLWCYANIPLVEKAPRITVIAEIWGELYDYGRQKVCLRASVRRDPREPAYDRFFRALFDIYRGHDHRN